MRGNILLHPVINRGKKLPRLGVTTVATNLLSAVICKNATSKEAGIRKLHDGDGLYLWVFLDGRKYWRMRYWQAGKEKALSIGVYPKVSLSNARKRREDLRKQLEANLDPSAERKATNLRKKLSAENSFKAVALEWYNKQLHTWVPHYADDIKRRLESNVFPALGKRPIDQIEAPELLQAMRKIETRGSYDLAHRVLQVCGQVFRYGIATGRCTRNLTADLRGALTPHVKQHQAAVRPEELPDLLRAIARYDEIGGKQTRLALQLLAQTFVRTSELIGAEWVEFDLDKALWVIPAVRMKMKTEHVVPLTRQALDLLTELKETSSGSRYVFPGKHSNKPIGNNTMLFALYRLGYKGKMTGHGFRAVASTILNETGHFKPDVIERQLAHCERNEVRGAYNRAEYLPERKRTMQYWADYLDSIEAAAKVIPMPGTAA
jgi:integrase